MASITFPRNIKLNLAQPLDNRLVVENEAAREALDYVYEGLVIFQKDTKKLYVATLNTESVLEWKEVGEGGGGAAEIYIRGYYMNNEFYTDSTYQTKCPHNTQKIYIDLNSSNYDFYHYENNIGYKAVAPLATSDLAGMMKLYNTHGQNTDGTMTQKYVTDGVNAIKFTTENIGDIDQDGQDDFALVLDLPWD